MAFFDENIITFFSILTILANIIILAFVADSILLKISKKRALAEVWKFAGKHAILLSFIVSLTAMVGSLLFSEVLHFEPCVLCWYQRIMIYPIAFLSLTALIRKDKKIMPFLVVLATIGFFIAGYHYYGQTNENTTLPCSALGYSVSCSEQFFLQFGYITIPLMAVSATLLIILLGYLDLETRNRKL